LTFDALVWLAQFQRHVYLQQLTEIHDVVSADGAVVYDDIPRPKSDSIPL